MSASIYTRYNKRNPRNSLLRNLNPPLRYRPPSPPFHCLCPCSVKHPSPSIAMVGGSRAPRPQSLLLCLAYLLAAGFMNIATPFIHHVCAPSCSSIVSQLSCTHFVTDTPPRYYQQISNLLQPNPAGASSGCRPTSSLSVASQVINYICFMNILAILFFYLSIQYIP